MDLLLINAVQFAELLLPPSKGPLFKYIHWQMFTFTFCYNAVKTEIK